MGVGPTGLDQSWGVADPATVASAGVRVVSMYLSYDPSKNITAAKVRAYHARRVAALINWEAQAGAPLNGAAQGRADAVEAVRQLRALIAAVGYAPAGRLTIYFSCDRDVTSAQIAGPVRAYYQAARDVCHAAGFGIGAYGEADLVDFLSVQGLTDSEWQTYAWSGGRLSTATDFYQYSNGQTLGGASVDFDRVIHSETLGAWWAPGDTMDRPTASEDDDMAMTATERKALVDDIAEAVWGKPHTSAEKVTHDMSTWLVSAQNGSRDALKALADPKTGVVVQVAALRKTVATISAAVAALKAPAVAAVDTAKIADAVAAKVRELKITLTGKAV